MLLPPWRFRLERRLLIGEVMNEELQIVTDDQRIRPEASEVNRLFGDNSRLRQLTGWQPSYGGLDGFRRGWRIPLHGFAILPICCAIAWYLCCLNYECFCRSNVESVLEVINKLLDTAQQHHQFA